MVESFLWKVPSLLQTSLLIGVFNLVPRPLIRFNGHPLLEILRGLLGGRTTSTGYITEEEVTFGPNN